MSVEAAGGALFDAIGRRNAQIFPGMTTNEAGEILKRHLARRGYRLVYDPVLAVEESHRYVAQEGMPPPVRAVKPEEPPVPSHLLYTPQTISVQGQEVRCSCGCAIFEVLANWNYRCASCGALYRGTE